MRTARLREDGPAGADKPRDDDCAKSLAKRTLTNLSNERPTWLDLAHQKLDAAVFAAYGWPADLADEEILVRLLKLNLERAGKSAWPIQCSPCLRGSQHRCIIDPGKGSTTPMGRVSNFPKSVSNGVLSEAEAVLKAQSSGKEWIHIALAKLDKLSEARPNWDSYGGLPLDSSVRDHAIAILGWLENEDLPTPEVVLGSGGTVQFEWQCHGKELEVEIHKDGSIGWLKVHPDERMEEGEIERPDASQVSGLAHWLRRE